MADEEAENLVAYGRLFSTAQQLPWRVVYLETVASRYAGDRIRQGLARALQMAQESGAEVLRLNLEIDSASRILSTIVQQAQSLGAGHILLGRQATGRRYFFNAGERLSDFAASLASHLPTAHVHILASPSSQAAPDPRPDLADAVQPGSRLQAMRLVAATLGICTLLSALIAPHLHPINLILIFLVGVVYVALRQSLKAALITVLLSIVVFNWLFVEPRWSLKPTDPEYFFTFVIMLCVGVAVSRLASRARQTALGAMVTAQHSQSLSLLAQSLAQARTLDEIESALKATVERDFGGQASMVLPGIHGELETAPHDQALEAHAKAVMDGSPAPVGVPCFPLAAGGKVIGVLLVKQLPASLQSASHLHLLQAYANQAAVAIERWQYAWQSEQTAVAAETERIRNILLAGISHDFRTPLTAIIGAASTVLNQGHAITLEQRNALAQSVLDQATRLQSLTSDLLDLARLQDGQVRLQPEWCPAEDLVRDAIAAVAPALGQHQIQLQLLPDDLVWCDATLTVQALSNLLLNASQHAPAGSIIQVRVQCEASLCRLAVHDQGRGLKPGTEREVFKKFYREPGTESPQGTGLGLAICELVARLHGGTIEARTDNGAVFEITLPQPMHHPALEESLA